MRLFIVLALLAMPLPTFGSVVISEVMCNPVGSDTDGEWIKIVNEGAEAVDITGWKFNDGSNHTLNVPPKNGGVGSMLIASMESAYLVRDASKVSLSGTVIDTAMSLNNTEDSLSLRNAEDAVVSTYTYGQETAFAEGEFCIGTGENVGTTETTATSTATTTTAVSSPATVHEVTTYRTVEIEPPQDIHIRPIDPMTAAVGSQVPVHAEVYNARGVVDQVQCIISFGNGSQGRSCSDVHVYEYPGVYVVHIDAKKGLLSDTSQFTLTVLEPEVSIIIDDALQFVEITNHGEHPLELSGWFIKIDYKRFPLPDHTILLPSQPLKISARVLQVDMARYAKYAQLINAFNVIVADSRISSLAVSLEAEKLPDEWVSQESDSVATIPVQESPHQEVLYTDTVTHRGGAHTSVIGTSVIEPISREDSKEDLVVIDVEPEEAVAAAMLSIENNAASRFLPNNVLPWFFGLFLLCCLAIIPLSLKQKEEQPLDDIDDSAESFTIEEIK